MPRVYTSQSSIHGTGVFAALHLMPGEIVLKIDDSQVITDADPLDSKKGEQEHHYDYLADGKVVLMQPPEVWVDRSAAGDHTVGIRPPQPQIILNSHICNVL
jgi:hypothetical protein